MTLRERVQQEDPECVDQRFVGGVADCPGDYGYLNCNDDMYSGTCSGHASCTACWDREYRAKWQQNIMNHFERVI